MYFLVPPLEGFVMNRVQGDYFETLLYKIFVSIDEQTNVAEVGFGEGGYCSQLHCCGVCVFVSVDQFILFSRCSTQLANVLEIDLGLVKVRIHCRMCKSRCNVWTKVLFFTRQRTNGGSGKCSSAF